MMGFKHKYMPHKVCQTKIHTKQNIFEFLTLLIKNKDIYSKDLNKNHLYFSLSLNEINKNTNDKQKSFYILQLNQTQKII